MARILIAGCGYVGEAVANAFHERGWEVEGWTERAESAAKLSQRPYAVRAVDVTDPHAVSNASGEFDVVIHCVSSRGGDEKQYQRLYFDGAKNLLTAFPRAALLFTSSTSVYPQTDGSIVDESSPADPRHGKGKILRETEDLVLAAGGIVARLGGIHGPRRSSFLTRFLERRTAVEENDRFINQVHRDDIVSALILLVGRRAETGGGIFNVVGDRPIKAKAAHDWLSSRLDTTGAALPGPTWEREPGTLARGGGTQRKRGQSNKQVSNRKLRLLGWEPRYPTFESAMIENILSSFGF
ncbi:MAG TPA: NAD-dependent epimerase/dehydratase family protein [Chthoniobacterales bacterium]|nr:NAD-dependent epimerase/dehydratase family protein [Chthoniobacterales bacterium]